MILIEKEQGRNFESSSGRCTARCKRFGPPRPSPHTVCLPKRLSCRVIRLVAKNGRRRFLPGTGNSAPRISHFFVKHAASTAILCLMAVPHSPPPPLLRPVKLKKKKKAPHRAAPGPVAAQAPVPHRLPPGAAGALGPDQVLPPRVRRRRAPQQGEGEEEGEGRQGGGRLRGQEEQMKRR